MGSGIARPALVKSKHFCNNSKWAVIFGLIAGILATFSLPLIRNFKIIIGTHFLEVKSLIVTIIVIIMLIFHKNNTEKSDIVEWHPFKTGFRYLEAILSYPTFGNCGVLLFFIPIIIIRACIDQKFTYFVLQSLKSDRTFFMSFQLQPAHVMILYQLFMIFFLIFNKYIFNRVLEAINFKKPLQQVIIGFILTILAFSAALHFEYQLNKTGPIIPKSNEAHFRIFNGMKCDYNIEILIEDQEPFLLPHMHMYQNLKTKIESKTEKFWYQIKLDGKMGFVGDPDECPSLNGTIELRQGAAMGYFIEYVGKDKIGLISYDDDMKRSKDLRPIVRFLCDTISEKRVKIIDCNGEVVRNFSSFSVTPIRLDAGRYFITVDDKSVILSEIAFKESEVYVIMILETDKQHDFQLKVMTPKPTISIWNIVPQFFLLTFAESLIIGNYSRWLGSNIPPKLRPLNVPLYFIATILGHILVICTEPFVQNEWHYALYAILMLINLIFLIFIMGKMKVFEIPKKTVETAIQEPPQIPVKGTSDIQESNNDNQNTTDIEKEAENAMSPKRISIGVETDYKITKKSTKLKKSNKKKGRYY
uniref:CSON005425 protein n=1 Tax=Culicoides sonorensis TaxID=179676 RepID=A0A336MUL4_CULSO